MLAQLLGGLVQGFERRTGQFELAAGLQTYGAAFRAVLAPKRDDVAVLGDNLVPTEPLVQGLEQHADAAFAVIRDRAMTVPVEAELLVLGADAPCASGLGARFEIGDELVTRLDYGA